MAANSPKLLSIARQKLSQLVHSPAVRYGRSRGLKAMKKPYAIKVMTVLDSMLQGCCLQFEGKFCMVKDGLARPMTVPEMARFTDIGQRCVERIIHDLKDLGLIQSEKQFKRLFPEGLKVSGVIRMFTKLFWESLGLWSLFVESVRYASENGKLKLKNPIKMVGKKKPPAVVEAERRRSQRDNQLFMYMCQCKHRKGEKACSGEYMAAEVCAICRKLSV